MSNLTASTLVQVTPSTAQPSTGCFSTGTNAPTGGSGSNGGSSGTSNNICSLIYQEGTQDSSCNILHADGTTMLQCYNPLCYSCTATGQLCPTSAPLSCGAACYDPSEYSCNVNAADYFASTLQQIPNGKATLSLPAICPGSGSPLAGTNGTVSQGFGSGQEIIQASQAPTTAPAVGAFSVPTPVFITLPAQQSTQAPTAQQSTQAPTAQQQTAAPQTQAAVVETSPPVIVQPTGPAPTNIASETIPPQGEQVSENICAAIYQEGDQDHTCNVLQQSGEVVVQCYNPACYTCLSGGQLCPANAPLACGFSCYDSGLATCNNGVLTQIQGGQPTSSLPAKCPGSGSPLAGTSGTVTVSPPSGETLSQASQAAWTTAPAVQSSTGTGSGSTTQTATTIQTAAATTVPATTGPAATTVPATTGPAATTGSVSNSTTVPATTYAPTNTPTPSTTITPISNGTTVVSHEATLGGRAYKLRNMIQ